jgi:hypothetical protein
VATKKAAKKKTARAAGSDKPVAGGSAGGLRTWRAHPVETHELLQDRALLARTRKARWDGILAQTEVPQELQEWAKGMEAQYGPVVQIHENHVGWVMALLIAIFGENEAYWPQKLGATEVARAKLWLANPSTTPIGVRYLPRGGGEKYLVGGEG